MGFQFSPRYSSGHTSLSGGGTNDGANSSFFMDDARLVTATNPLALIFNAYDAGSGIHRMGAIDAGRYMSVTFEGVATNNVINYVKSESTVPAVANTSSSVWM